MALSLPPSFPLSRPSRKRSGGTVPFYLHCEDARTGAAPPFNGSINGSINGSTDNYTGTGHRTLPPRRGSVRPTAAAEADAEVAEAAGAAAEEGGGGGGGGGGAVGLGGKAAERQRESGKAAAAAEPEAEAVLEAVWHIQVTALLTALLPALSVWHFQVGAWEEGW